MGDKVLGRSGGKFRRSLREAGPILGEQRKARRKAGEAAIKQEGMIARQEKIEKQRLAKEESEVKRRKAIATGGKAGRSSLIATSQTGLAKSLGGGNG